MRALVSILALGLVAACGLPSPSDTSGGDATTTSATPPDTAPGDGVDIILTGAPTLTADDRIEICPPGWIQPCPGVIVEGLAELPAGAVVRVTGSYDGARLFASQPAEDVSDEFGQEPHFSSLCPNLEGSPNLNPPEPVVAAITAYGEEHASEFAGTWWDSQTRVMTAWFVGDDVEAHRLALAEATGGATICVAGGARFSEAELLEAADGLAAFHTSNGGPLVTGGWGVDTVGNRVTVFVDEIDESTSSRIAAEFGERVELEAYIEIVTGTLAELPPPVLAVPGDVDIRTASTRSGGGMDALGRFVLAFDHERGCAYFGSAAGTGERVVPVWPFGYSARANPLTIYDFDGNVVAAEGDTLEVGGGNAPITDPNGDCGSSDAWIMNGGPLSTGG